jgi:hypothetical protein
VIRSFAVADSSVSVALPTIPNMTDELRNNEPNTPLPGPRVLIVDLDSRPSPYPEDGLTLLERWANVDPPNNPDVGAITKTTASFALGSFLRLADQQAENGEV